MRRAKSSTNQESQGAPTSASLSSAPAQRNEGVLCWRCHSRGHIQANHPLQEEPMECGALRRMSFYAQNICAANLDLTEGLFECDLWVNQLHVRAMLDSGSMVTLVGSGVAGEVSPVARALSLVCIHGDTREYPLVSVTLTTACDTIVQEVGVVPNLIHDAIIGRDCPLFVELWNYVSQELSGQLNCSVPSMGLDANALENIDRVSSGADGPPAEGNPEGREPTLMQVMAGENIEEAFPLQVMTEEDEGESSSRLAHPVFEVSRGAFSSAQKRDPTLENAWQQVIIINGFSQVPEAEKRFPRFVVIGELLYRVTEVRGDVVDQLLVPQPFRCTVLDLAHNDALGGHLGTDKTEAQITDRFY